jgi:hypothetical protein
MGNGKWFRPLARALLIALAAWASLWLMLQARNWVEYLSYGVLIACAWAAKIHTIRKAETPFESLVRRFRGGDPPVRERHN